MNYILLSMKPQRAFLKYALALLFFALCMALPAQMLKPSNPATKFNFVDPWLEFPDGMVWQNVAVNDNGVKRYWHYTNVNEPIALQATKGSSDADLWAFVQLPNTDRYFVFNKAAGSACILMSQRLPQGGTISSGVEHSLVVRNLKTTTVTTSVNILFVPTIDGASGFRLQPFTASHFVGYNKALRVGSIERSGNYYLHLAEATATANTLMVSEDGEVSKEELEKEKFFATLTTYLSEISQVISQSTQTKAGVVGYCLPDTRARLSTLYNAYQANPTDFATAKALLDFYLKAVENNDCVAVQSGKLYRFVNVYEKFGSMSLGYDPVGDTLRLVPTDAQDRLQKFVLLKKEDGYYIGNPHTGKFLAIPSTIGKPLVLNMRSLYTHLDFEDGRLQGEYKEIGKLVPYSGDASIQQIKVRSDMVFGNSHYLYPLLKNDQGNLVGFLGPFSSGLYKPDGGPSGDTYLAGWYVYPAGEMELSQEAFVDLIRGANIADIAGRPLAPTVSAAAPLVAAYKAAVATYPPSPTALDNLHREATLDKINAMPWVKPRPNIAFNLYNQYSRYKDEAYVGLPYFLAVWKDLNNSNIPPILKSKTTLPLDRKEGNAFVFVPTAEGTDKFKLWTAIANTYLSVNPDGSPGLYNQPVVPSASLAIFTLRPYHEDYTHFSFTMQAADGRYLSFLNKANKHDQIEPHPELMSDLSYSTTRSSVWGYDSSSLVSVAYIDALSYTTFSSPNAVMVPNGVAAMKVTAYNNATNTLDVVPVTSSTIPAKVGVVLKGASGPYHLATTTATAADVALYADNLLVANVEPKVMPEPVYMLSGTSETDVSFYRSRAGIVFPARRAYLPNSVIFNAAPAVSFLDIVSTVASPVVPNRADTPIYYDLQGRRVPNPTKGIYIVNGKKVIL